MMELRKIRAELRMGRSVFDLPLRVTYYARVSTDKFEQQLSLEHQTQYFTEFIESRPNWTFVDGYVDEGISGTSTKKRDSFNRMIADAKNGCFDFIITKEISRFSRSTHDSIKYTQELLDHNVGVLFQSDNINTYDPDSEFRLVVMAGVAQDEVRKLSERLKFGFKQSIKNGRVLGNDKLWGYDKKNCRMEIKEDEAVVVRAIFDLYANEGLGVRKLSQRLFDMGHTSRNGNEFNVLTIRNILTNPKYKGWYCGNKSTSVDYRNKKNVKLDEDEWITYPDPAIPAIVPEELWDRANKLYKSRSKQVAQHQQGSDFHSKYAYSGKIVCEEHSTSFHRSLLKASKGDTEVWRCKVYRQRGRAACHAPQIRTRELDEIMAQIFSEMVGDKAAIVNALLSVIKSVPTERNYTSDIAKTEAEIAQIMAKKERLLEMSIDNIITMTEFKQRNDSLNEQVSALQKRIAYMQQIQNDSNATTESLVQVKLSLERDLDFSDRINSELVSSILDKVVVKQNSTKESVNLDIFLKIGDNRNISYSKDKSSFCFDSLRSITPLQAIRRICCPSAP